MTDLSITEPVDLGQLAAELQAALSLPEPPALIGRNPGQTAGEGKDLPGVVVVPDGVDPAVAKQVVAAHEPAPTDPDAELAASIAVIDTSKVSDAATKAALDALKSALTGKGKSSAVRGRRTTA